MDKKWYTTKQAADVAEVSQSWIIKMLKDGKIPYTWFGGRRKISAKDVNELVRHGSKNT